MSVILYLILGALVVAVLWVIGIYNGLVRLNNRTKEAWSDIDVQLKRRHDLIPNLVATVKGYATHERELFEKVTQARAAAVNAGSLPEKAQAENALTGALKTVFAVAENYPELKASENFAKLQDELSDTENKIQAARRFYNSNARDFNIKIQTFPNNIIAGYLKFKEYDFFEVMDKKERENVAVKF